jgi:hypothetical protein
MNCGAVSMGRHRKHKQALLLSENFYNSFLEAVVKVIGEKPIVILLSPRDIAIWHNYKGS